MPSLHTLRHILQLRICLGVNFFTAFFYQCSRNDSFTDKADSTKFKICILQMEIGKNKIPIKCTGRCHSLKLLNLNPNFPNIHLKSFVGKHFTCIYVSQMNKIGIRMQEKYHQL